ncbi:MAG: hypothetical protein HUU49_03400 [Candidatus Buchananbacteria bacterium]|nr:hypothetical protein [Candidatus Buchananbacteria bacterium]
MKNNLKIALGGIGEVFTKPLYLLLAAGITLILFLAGMWFNNYGLLGQILFSGTYGATAKLKIFFSSFQILLTNYDIIDQFLIVLLSLLIGINVSLQAYYFRKRATLQKIAGGSLLGAVLGFLGVGCASCGSIVVTSLFGFSASAGFLGVLPFGGLEFGIVGFLILLISTYLIAKKINSPLIC